LTGDRPGGFALLKRPRHRIERDFARALGMSLKQVRELASQTGKQAGAIVTKVS